MNRASDGTSATARTAPPPSGRRDGRPNGRPEIDLERLVWDPEYREAMRPWLRQAG